MKRISTKEEMDLMLPDSNKRNIKNFGDLIKHFYYDYDTNERIRRNLNSLTKPFPHNYLDKKLNLNSQLRSFYKIKLSEEVDPAFKEYMEALDYNFLRYARSMDGYYPSTIYEEDLKKEMVKKSRQCKRYKLTDYETFKSGKIKVGKQQQKLFKFCLAKGLLSEPQVDSINTLKTGKGGLYVCVTRNPVDYLFASTNQSFTSCLNLESDGENCYWMGLGSLNLDPNRFMCFLTKGKVSRYKIKGYEFKHFTYLSRTWILLDSKDRVLIVKPYPSEHINFLRELNKIENLSVFKDEDDFHQGKFSLKIPRYEDGEAASIYCDDIGYAFRNQDALKSKKTKGNKEKTWYMSADGCESGALTEFEYAGTFEQLESYAMLRDNSSICEYCGDHSRESDTYWFENTGTICYTCFNDNFVTCSMCAVAIDINIEVAKEGSNGHYCEDCFYRENIKCDYCGEDESDQDSFNVSGEDICSSCYEEHFFVCENCEESYNVDYSRTAEDILYCEDCYDDNFLDCTDCGDVFRKDDMEEIKLYLYCCDCAEDWRTENETANEAV